MLAFEILTLQTKPVGMDMTIEKAMIIIAVSRYDGSYSNLPGTITSAQKLHKWAKQKDEDLNYKVLYLGDDKYSEITVELIREKLEDFLNNNIIDRLIVYFAGHGIVRSAGDQFWLLTHADNDPRQGINVEAFRRGLLKTNLGKYNDDLSGQLCIIGDACRNTGVDGIDFYGDPIITSINPKNSIQLDRFLSTGLGDLSFQIDATNKNKAYCLFSDVLLTGLSGSTLETIETNNHQFSPAITNHKLADYLEKEVAARAAEFGETMEPDILSSIRPPYNYYKLIKNTPPPSPPPPSSTPSDSISPSGLKASSQDISIKKNIDILVKEVEYFFYSGFNPIEESRLILDFPPSKVAIPKSNEATLERFKKHFFINNNIYSGNPLLVKQNEKWIIVPYYQGVKVIVSSNLPGDILLYLPRKDEWDKHLSDFSNLVDGAPLRASQAKQFADKIRVGKEEFPHQAVTAGYLYEFSNDYENIARTAHYMARSGIVPFDLALLCATKIEWREHEGEIRAFADLPEVKNNTDFENDRPYYTNTSFKARKNVLLWGIVPVYPQGWNFMQSEKYLNIPEAISKIGEQISGRSSSLLNDEQLIQFVKVFNYQIVNFKEQTEPESLFMSH